MTAERIALLNVFGARLTGGLAFVIPPSGEVPETHPLAGELTAVLLGRPASLPYPHGSEMIWATLAPSSDLLRRMIEDLRCWVLPSFGWEGRPAIVSAGAPGQLTEALLAHSPQGYFRWHSRMDQTAVVIGRLHKLREVVAGAPARAVHIRQTVEALRRQYAVGLATGDFDRARVAIDEIDQRQLDTATNALSMRIRLLSRFGRDREIVEHPQLEDLLSTRLTRRVAESVLAAHHGHLVAGFEAAGDIDGALEAYAACHARLDGLLDEPAADADPAVIRMAAYGAVLSDNGPALRALALRFPHDEVVADLASRVPEPAPAAENGEARALDEDPPKVAVSAPSHEDHDPPMAADSPDWTNVTRWVLEGETGRLADFLQRVDDVPDDIDPGDGEFIVELFTADGISGDTARSRAAETVLTAVIDAYVCEDLFPRRERLPFYQALLDVWASARELSSDAKDGQLLITLAEALLRLDARFEKGVATALGGWWRARPVRSRLVWLSEAISLLTDHSINADYLALWYSGAALIRQDSRDQTFDDWLLWRRLGSRLGLDLSVADEALGYRAEEVEVAADPLTAVGYAKIAIVSLHERPAVEAAAQIRERTAADVIVVVEHAAGEATASAATADVILFVWGANKHAVYRAFDKVRDRLEYVQGTGSASIVRALARRAATAR